MRPKLNKLITLLLLLGTFAFLMEAEERVSSLAKKELSKWASVLPVTPESNVTSLNPYDHDVSIIKAILEESSENKVKSIHN